MLFKQMDKTTKTTTTSTTTTTTPFPSSFLDGDLNLNKLKYYKLLLHISKVLITYDQYNLFVFTLVQCIFWICASSSPTHFFSPFFFIKLITATTYKCFTILIWQHHNFCRESFHNCNRRNIFSDFNIFGCACFVSSEEKVGWFVCFFLVKKFCTTVYKLIKFKLWLKFLHFVYYLGLFFIFVFAF